MEEAGNLLEQKCCDLIETLEEIENLLEQTCRDLINELSELRSQVLLAFRLFFNFYYGELRKGGTLMEEVRVLLEQKCCDLMDELSELEPGSVEHTRVSVDLSRLLAQVAEIEKVNVSQVELIKREELETEKRKSEFKSAMLGAGIAAGGSLIANLVRTIVYRVCYKDGCRLEDEHFFSRQTVKNLNNKISFDK